MKYAAGLILAGLAGLVSGCSGRPQESVAALQQQLEAKDEELAEMREHYDERLDDFVAVVSTRHAEELAQLAAAHDAERAALTRTIQSLQAQQSADDPAPMAAPEPDPPLATTFPPTPTIEVVSRRASPTVDAFPVEVAGVEGRKVVIGTHKSTRLVKTDEIYKDSFGQEKNRVVPETIEIPDYAYQASAVVSNRSEAMLEVSIRCGSAATTLEIDAGEAREIEVAALRGAPLTLRIGNEVRSFPVVFP